MRNYVAGKRKWLSNRRAVGERIAFGPARVVGGPARLVDGPARLVDGPARIVDGPARIVDFYVSFEFNSYSISYFKRLNRSSSRSKLLEVRSIPCLRKCENTAENEP